jgi:hypothetical protein
MSTNIPPALDWLVKRRRAVAGLLDKATKRETQLQAAYEADQEQLKLQISALQKDLAALDQTIGLHEILIDTSKLGATHVQLAPRLTAYAKMTRAVLTALRNARPEPMTTDAIVSSVCIQCDLHPDAAEYVDMRRRVRHRLKSLVADGKVPLTQCQQRSARLAHRADLKVLSGLPLGQHRHRAPRGRAVPDVRASANLAQRTHRVVRA